MRVVRAAYETRSADPAGVRPLIPLGPDRVVRTRAHLLGIPLPAHWPSPIRRSRVAAPPARSAGCRAEDGAIAGASLACPADAGPRSVARGRMRASPPRPAPETFAGRAGATGRPHVRQGRVIASRVVSAY